MNPPQPLSQTILREYLGYTAGVSVRNSKVASLLVIFLMPAGIVLDLMVYPERLKEFGTLRLVSSGLAALVWLRLRATKLSATETKLLCLGWWVLPAFFISWMIAVTEGADSPYYAGLSLVILAVSTVIQATLRESLRAFLFIVGLYLVACFINPFLTTHDVNWHRLGNNLYFIGLTSLIVLVGNHYYNQLRYKEFSLRFELDLNQKELETSNQALGQKKEELEGSNQQLSQKTGDLERTLIELRQTQEQLVTKEKQASLGVWSAGIIHEMNNPLNFARTGLYALRNTDKHLPEAERADFKEVMADIEEGINRVHMIVSDLRTYAHPGMEECDEVPAAEVVRVALRFFSGDLQGRVEVIQKIPADQIIFANRNKLIQVLGNLFQNSVDALKAKPFDQDHPTITIEGRVENGRSRLILRDNGPGIEKKHLDKIFDPFFTTKEVGKGMGLGLGICYRIVQEFGGTISVKSEPGQFCEFTLDFPEERPPEKPTDEG